MTAKTALENLARAHVDGRMGYKIMYYEQLNPEQKLAYVLEKLLGHQKETLLLMEVCKLVAEEAVAWKKTPEGVAWAEEQARKRAEAAKNAKQDQAINKLLTDAGYVHSTDALNKLQSLYSLYHAAFNKFMDNRP